MTDSSPLIIAAGRTPFAPVHGELSGWHPVDALAEVLRRLPGADALREAIGFVAVGCAEPVGSQGANVARAAVVRAGWPLTVPAVTIDQAEVAGLAALVAAGDAVRSGRVDVAVAAGVGMVSRVPPGASALGRQYGRPWGAAGDRFADAGGLVPPGVAADRLAAASGLDRSQLDAHAVDRRAAPVAPPSHILDVTIRRDDREHAGRSDASVDRDRVDPAAGTDSPPLFADDGTTSASNIAPDADGAGAVVLASPRWAAARGHAALASVASIVTGAGDPVTMWPAAGAFGRAALANPPADLAVVDIDAPFAVVDLVTARHLADADRHGDGDKAPPVRLGSGFTRGRAGAATGLAQAIDVLAWLGEFGGGSGLIVGQSSDASAIAAVLRVPGGATLATGI